MTQNAVVVGKFVVTICCGAILSILVVGCIAGIARDNVVDDCQKMGAFRQNDKVFACEAKNDTAN